MSRPSLIYGADEAGASQKYHPPGTFNVKDFNAKGDGVTDDTAAIQAAVDAALAATHAGGTVFFPPGRYFITAPISGPGSSGAQIKLKGCGTGANPQFNTFSSSTIYTNSDNYMVKVTPHVGTPGNPDLLPFGSIEDLGFYNQYAPRAGTIKSTETACGGIYIPGGIGFRMVGCAVTISGGLALYCAGQNVRITGCYFNGGFAGTNGKDQLGVWLGGGGYLGDCKLQSFGTAVMCGSNGGAFVSIDNIGIEVSGCGILLGEALIDFWDQINQTTLPAGSACSVISGSIRIAQMESIGDRDKSTRRAFIYCHNAGCVTVENCHFFAYGQVGQADYGLYAGGAGNSTFRNMTIFAGGGGAPAGFAVANVQAGGHGNVFRSINPTGNDTSGKEWEVSRIYWNKSYHFNGNDFSLNTGDGGDGAIPMAYLHPSPAVYGQTSVVSDSPLDNAVANWGQPLTAIIRTNAATPPSSNELHFASGVVPSWVTAGSMIIQDWDTPNAIGDFVVSKVATTAPTGGKKPRVAGGTTVTMGNNPYCDVASGDRLAFTRPPGSNKVLARWNGTSWVVAG